MVAKKNKPKNSRIIRHKKIGKVSSETKLQKSVSSVLKKLSVSHTPKRLLCRDNFKNVILKRIRKFVSTSSPGGSGFYISGMPGTGKTSCINEALRETMNDKTINKNSFLLIEINAMKLSHPYSIYTELWKKLKDSKVNPRNAVFNLKKVFSGELKLKRIADNNNALLICIDEMDALINEKENIIYNLFDWPSHSPVIKTFLIGAANIVHLPESLSKKLHSRIEIQNLVFPPYAHDEIEKILQDRIKDCDILNEDCIMFCSKKVASLSGDVRHVLAICSRILENFIENGGKMIEIDDIRKAIEELEFSVARKTVKNLSEYQKLLLLSILLCIGSKSKGNTTFTNVLNRFQIFLGKLDERIKKREVLEMLFILEEQGLVQVKEWRYNDFCDPLIDLGALEEDLRLLMKAEDIVDPSLLE